MPHRILDTAPKMQHQICVCCVSIFLTSWQSSRSPMHVPWLSTHSYPFCIIAPGNPLCLRIVLGSPVSRLEKDWDWTGPRPEKTRKNKTGQDWRLEKTAQKPVFMDRSLRLRPVWTSDSVPLIMSPRSPKTVNIWLRNKLNCTMLTKIVDLA